MPKMVKRIKLDSDTTGTTGAYLTTDLSDKNAIVDHTVPNMNFVTVAVSNNNLIAVNGNDNKVYKSTVGSKVWELVPNIVIDSGDVKYADSNGLNIQVFDNVVILNCPNTKKMYYSNNSGDTWVSYSVTRQYYQSVIYRNTIYTLCDMGNIIPGVLVSINLMTGEETEYGRTGTLIYVLNDVLILASGVVVETGTTKAYYFNNNYTSPGDAFLPIMNYASSYPSNGYNYGNYDCVDMVSRKNYSTKYTIGARYYSTIDIYDSTIKTISLDDIINNPIKSYNILTSGRKGITDGISNINNRSSVRAEYPQLRVYDDFIIYIKNHVFSVSTDGGSTFTSINTGSSIGDVIAHNGALYIFSGNMVKTITPSIIDNSNIISNDPNIGYSLVNPKQAGNFGKNGYAKYLNNIEVTPGEKIKINVTSPDGGVRLVWGTNRYFPTNAS